MWGHLSLRQSLTSEHYTFFSIAVGCRLHLLAGYISVTITSYLSLYIQSPDQMQLGIAGTQLRLHYNYFRQSGYKPVLNIPLSGPDLPESVKAIVLEIQVTRNDSAPLCSVCLCLSLRNAYGGILGTKCQYVHTSNICAPVMPFSNSKWTLGCWCDAQGGTAASKGFDLHICLGSTGRLW